MINIEEPGGSERGGHVYMFWANHLGHPEMSPTASLRVFQILLEHFWQCGLANFSNWGTLTIRMLFLAQAEIHAHGTSTRSHLFRHLPSVVRMNCSPSHTTLVRVMNIIDV